MTPIRAYRANLYEMAEIAEQNEYYLYNIPLPAEDFPMYMEDCQNSRGIFKEDLYVVEFSSDAVKAEDMPAIRDIFSDFEYFHYRQNGILYLCINIISSGNRLAESVTKDAFPSLAD